MEVITQKSLGGWVGVSIPPQLVLPLRISLLALLVGGMEGSVGMCQPHSLSGPQRYGSKVGES